METLSLCPDIPADCRSAHKGYCFLKNPGYELETMSYYHDQQYATSFLNLKNCEKFIDFLLRKDFRQRNLGVLDYIDDLSNDFDKMKRNFSKNIKLDAVF